jgi:hypothetical protein
VTIGLITVVYIQYITCGIIPQVLLFIIILFHWSLATAVLSSFFPKEWKSDLQIRKKKLNFRMISSCYADSPNS